MICLNCDHPEARHAGGTGDCRECDEACKAYEGDSGATVRAIGTQVDDTPLAPLPPLAEREVWLCTRCGTESDLPGSDEHGALTPVTVTVTYRTQ